MILQLAESYVDSIHTNIEHEIHTGTHFALNQFGEKKPIVLQNPHLFNGTFCCIFIFVSFANENKAKYVEKEKACTHLEIQTSLCLVAYK